MSFRWRKAGGGLGREQSSSARKRRTPTGPEEMEEEEKRTGRQQMDLFPLDCLLPEVLQQEELLWQRNQLLLQALRAGRLILHLTSPLTPSPPHPLTPRH